MTNEDRHKLLKSGYTPKGKVFGGIPIGKSELRSITSNREIIRLKAINKK